MTWSRISRRALPTQRSAIPFCQGACTLGPFRLQARGLQERDHFGIELRIVIQNSVTIRFFSGECLPKLLDNPICGWVSGDVAEQNLATRVINDKEAIEQLEGDRRYGEEVECHDHFAMIVQERQPTSFRMVAPTDSA
jgi:hypothetical protein